LDIMVLRSFGGWLRHPRGRVQHGGCELAAPTTVPGPAGTFRHDFSGGCGPITHLLPLDLTSLLVPGDNTLTFEMIEGCGGGSGAEDLYLTITAPA
jgi:hypothetical protein